MMRLMKSTSTRVLALLLLQFLGAASALAQNTASPPSLEAERTKQEKIYPGRGELRLEGYVIDRSLSAYMRALLRQDAAWHDTNRTGEAASRLAEETVLWQAGIGEKLTGAIKFSVTFVAGLAVGFSKSWALTLVIFACTPALVFIIAFLKVATQGYESDAAKAYARSRGRAS